MTSRREAEGGMEQVSRKIDLSLDVGSFSSV